MRSFRVLVVRWMSMLEWPFRNMVFVGYFFGDLINVIFDVSYEM